MRLRRLRGVYAGMAVTALLLQSGQALPANKQANLGVESSREQAFRQTFPLDFSFARAKLPTQSEDDPLQYSRDRSSDSPSILPRARYSLRHSTVPGYNGLSSTSARAAAGRRPGPARRRRSRARAGHNCDVPSDVRLTSASHPDPGPRERHVHRGFTDEPLRSSQVRAVAEAGPSRAESVSLSLPLTLAAGEQVTPTSVRCSAKVGETACAEDDRETRGTARCTWKLPAAPARRCVLKLVATATARPSAQPHHPRALNSCTHCPG